MLQVSRHKLLILLLGLALVVAPIASIAESIGMSGHGNAGQQHCAMDMSKHGDMDMPNMTHMQMEHGSCCQHDGACQDNCSNCSQCFSAHPVLFSHLPTVSAPMTHQYLPQIGLLTGQAPGHQLRPPKLSS